MLIERKIFIGLAALTALGLGALGCADECLRACADANGDSATAACVEACPDPGSDTQTAPPKRETVKGAVAACVADPRACANTP